MGAASGVAGTGDDRFPLLDGVRAVAALMVLLTHVSFITRANVDHPLGPEMARLNTGVSVFFVLSGFLLYRPFVAARLAGRDRPDTAPYLWRRLLRIYPAYWLALFVVLAFGPATVPDAQSLILWGSLMHVLSPEHFFGPLLQSYTLGIEIHFYLFIPLWAWFVRRLPGPAVRTELVALAALFAAGVGWQLFCLGQEGALESVWRNNLPGFFDHFAVGMGVAVVHAHGRAGLDRLRAVPGWVWAAVAVGSIVVMGRGLGIARTDFYVEWWQDLAIHLLGLVLAVGLLGAGLFALGRGGRAVLGNPVARWLGVVSYGIYLWHEFLLDRFVAWGDWSPPFESNPAPFELTLVAVVAASVVVASASWLLLEQPVLRFKRLVRSTAGVLDGGRLGTRLAALAAVGFVIRLLFVLGWRRLDSVGGDPYWYHQGANLLADGHGFVNVFRFDEGIVQPGADHPPAYLVWLALSSVVGFTSLLSHQVWSCVLGALAVPCCGLAGFHLGGRRTAFAAAAIAAVSPLLWVYDALVLSETLAITSMAAAAWLALRARRSPARDDWRTLAGLGAALGVLVLTRAEALLLVPFVVVGAVGWRRIRPLLFAGGACAVVVAPWVVANLVRFDHPATLSTQLGTTLAHAYCDDTFDGPHVGWWSYPCAANLPVPPGDTSNADIAYREVALDYAGDHLGRLPVVVAARVGRTFGLFDPDGQATLDRVEGRPKGTALLAAVLWYPTAILSVVGWVALRRRGWSLGALAPLWAPVACVLVTVVAFYGTTRFRALAEPAFAVLAACALTRSHLSRGRRSRHA